jgi:ribonucleoside-diphosphate reductase beta chain
MNLVPQFFNRDGNDDVSLRELLYSDQAIQNSTGTWNLNKTKRGFADRFFESQWAFLWRPDEIDMSQDASQFHSLDPRIQFSIETTLSFLQYIESCVAENLILVKLVTNDYEIKRALSLHEMVEAGIHTESYQTILKALCGEDDKRINEIYYRFKDFKPLAKRNYLISREFQSLRDLVWNGLLHADEKKFKQQVFRALVQDYFIEGVVFYAGFNLFHFMEVEHQILSGANRNIVLIRRDEELHVPLFANIISTFKVEYPEYYHEDMIYEIAEKSAEADIEFYVEAYGDNIPGLTSKVVETYIRYLTDKRLKLLGLKPLYGEERNPLEHIELISMGSEAKKASFMETGNTDYQHVSANWDEILSL